MSANAFIEYESIEIKLMIFFSLYSPLDIRGDGDRHLDTFHGVHLCGIVLERDANAYWS
jgi:hypothetical protein